jgi:hypothetical protein
MSTNLFLALAGAVIAGLVLIVLGLRGKRINKVPACAQCGFDLSGVLPDGVTCPECGAGLKRKGGVRVGQRRRRCIVIGVGAVAIALPGVTLGMAFFALMTGRDVNDYKPVAMLMWEARKGDRVSAVGAGAELYDRMQLGALAPHQVDALTQLALDIQADRDRPWSEAWGDIIAMHSVAGNLSREDKLRYERGMPVFTVSTRPKVEAGGVIPILIELDESRIGGGEMATSTVSLADRTIGDSSIARIAGDNPFDAFGVMSQQFDGQFQLIGSTMRWYAGMSQSVGVLLRLPDDLAPGRHELTMDLESHTALIDQSRNMVVWSSMNKPTNVRRDAISIAINVVAAGDDAIELVEATPEMDDRLHMGVTPQQVWAFKMGRQTTFMAQFGGSNPPVDLACDVYLRCDGVEHRVGTLTTGSPASNAAGMSFWSQTNTFGVSGQVPSFTSRRVDLILRPNPEVARRTIDVTRIYAGELVYEDIEVEHQDSGGGFGLSLFQALGAMFSGGGASDDSAAEDDSDQDP